ncbi:MAG TPA: DUF2723 domain-containing protein [Planctomycetota bacterium]|nr:DUF2723 domain-containing protein [Planctomycetota bacterium]
MSRRDEGTARRLTYWKRRYLLREYDRFGDADLAAATGLSTATVHDFLTRLGATRSPGDLRRIAQSDERPPVMFTPSWARARLTRLHTRPLTRVDGLLLALMFVGSVLLYGSTAARTVTGEDSGEFLAAAHTFGVPHPPGYPFWLLLAWVAEHLLAFGTVAFRVTLVSLLPSALANTLLLVIALKTLRSRLAACAGAALFTVSLTHWTQAVIPEVYGLNTLFVALQVLMLVRLAEGPSAGRLLLLAFVTGLSATVGCNELPSAFSGMSGEMSIAS